VCKHTGDRLQSNGPLFIRHSKEAQKRGLLFITNPFPMHGALALRASYFTTHLVCKQRKQSASTIGINKLFYQLLKAQRKSHSTIHKLKTCSITAAIYNSIRVTL
jgi:hypothetical protein